MAGGSEICPKCGGDIRKEMQEAGVVFRKKVATPSMIDAAAAPAAPSAPKGITPPKPGAPPAPKETK